MSLPLIKWIIDSFGISFNNKLHVVMVLPDFGLHLTKMIYCAPVDHQSIQAFKHSLAILVLQEFFEMINDQDFN